MKKLYFSDEFITQDLEKGGKFVQFQYVIITPFYWTKNPTNIYYIPSDKRAISKGWPYLLISIFLGFIAGGLSYKATDVTDAIKKARLILSKRFNKNYTYLDTIYSINQDIDRYADIFQASIEDY